ncbi:MAG TPA: hypothetical protein VH951_12365 [Dehalococcoidia bacterium]
MATFVGSLSESQQSTLRREFQTPEPTGWVLELARQKNWREANEAFLQSERARGRDEMAHLMKSFDIAGPVAPDKAASLVAAALELFLGQSPGRSDVELVDPWTVKLRVCDCPTYRRLEASDWRGVTACSSWHRRRGWYDALGVRAEDSVVAESKWGDEACEALIEFPRPDA